jgi:hypothetical protein
MGKQLCAILFFINFFVGCSYIEKLQKPNPVVVAPKPTPTKKPSVVVAKKPTIDTTSPAPVINIPNPLVTKCNQKVTAFVELSAKIKMKGTMDGSTKSFTTNLRWKKGEKIWLSMSILGIEGVRVLIRKDSVFMVDKLNKYYWAEPYSFLEKKAGTSLPFEDLENLLLGNLINTIYTTKDTTAGMFLLNGTYNSSAITAKIDTINTLLKEMVLDDKIQNRNLHAQFDDYTVFNGRWWANKRNIKIISKENNITLECFFDKIEISKDLEYPFTISEKYTRGK